MKSISQSEINKRIEILRRASIFSETGQDMLEAISVLLSEIRLKCDEIVFGKGEHGDSMFIISDGKVKVHDENHVFTILKKGDVFGEYSLIDSQVRSASVSTLEDSILLQLDQATFFRLMKNEPDITKGVFRAIMKRLYDKDALESQLAQRNIEIQQQKEEIQSQRDEIEAQRDFVTKQRDEIQQQHDEILRKEMILQSHLTAINACIGAVEYDINGRIISVNDWFLSISETGLPDLIGKHNSDFMPEQKKASPKYELFWEQLKKGIVQAGGHQYFFNGKEKWFYESFTPVMNEKGEITKFLALVNDITKVRHQELKIIQQKKELEKKNKDITDSIHYASRIQSAVLPPEEFFKESLPEHFVIFKPRDIVSGDFYWMKQIGKHVIIAAADCTGHGVPGAFMSMLGVSLLNELVNRQEIICADGLLNHLREQVKSALRQTGKRNEAQDGMDMAVCIINLESRQLEFAGANSPLYFVRKNTQMQPSGKQISNEKYTLTHIKADSMPIGIYLKEKTFTKKTIKLAEGDTFYMMSDGFVDQIGGELGKKYLSKRLKQKLLGIQNKNMTEQGEFFEKELAGWMRHEYEQIDDILIIGVRVDDTFGDVQLF